MAKQVRFGFLLGVAALNIGCFIKSYNPAYHDTRLHWAASSLGPTAVHREIAKANDVDVRDRRGQSPLMVASASNHQQNVWALLAAGADVHAADNRGRTPLMLAAARGSPESVRLLLSAGADVNAVDHEGRTALMNGVVAGWAGHHGAYRPQQDVISIVSLLLDSGADVHVQDERGATAILIGADFSDRERLSLLLKAGASLEFRDNEGMTPLLRASRRNPGVIPLFLEAGADVRARDANGRTALMYVAPRLYEGYDFASRLLAAGADLEEKDDRGWTPLMYAAMEGQMPMAVDYLLALGASVEPAHWTPLVLSVIRRDKSCFDECLLQTDQVDVRDAFGRTALMWASRFDYVGEQTFIAKLLDAGANVNECDNDGMTPLMLATQWNFPRIMELLIGAGADMELPDEHGRTALMIACANGWDNDKVALLLEHGANVHATDNEGRTAMMYAAERGHDEVVEMLRNAEADSEQEDKHGVSTKDRLERIDAINLRFLGVTRRPVSNH